MEVAWDSCHSTILSRLTTLYFWETPWRNDRHDRGFLGDGPQITWGDGSDPEKKGAHEENQAFKGDIPRIFRRIQ